MIKLITYNQKGDSLFEFNFQNNIEVEQRNDTILSVFATKQHFVFGNMSFMAYDTDLSFLPISAEWLSLSKQLIEQAYNEEGRILMIFSSADEPIGIFKASDFHIKFGRINNNICKITMNEKTIWLSSLHFILIAPKSEKSA